MRADLVVSEDYVDTCEQEIDRWFQSVALPGDSRESSTWHLLTLAEDMMRNLLTNRKVDLFAATTRFIGDTAALKHTIRLIWGTQQPANFLDEAVSEESYRCSFDLLTAGLKYEQACWLFGFYWNKMAHCQRIAQKHGLHFYVNGALFPRLMTLAPSRGPAPARDIVVTFLHTKKGLPSRLVRAISKDVEVVGNKLSPHFNSDLCGVLMKNLPPYKSILPDGWIFPWGERNAVIAFIQALYARLVYHILAVHYGARRKHLDGCGVDSLVLCQGRETWIDELVLLSRLPKSCVAALTDAMTFTDITVSPDPMLQPLIPCGSTLMCAPLHTLSLVLDRNLLALHARTNSETFDSQSDAFAKKMTEEIESVCRRTYSRTHTMAKPPDNERVGDLDLLIIDPVSKQLFIGELKWTMPPDGPRETIRRLNDGESAIKQIKLKTAAIQNHLTSFLSRYAVTVSNEAEWQVWGAVICEGFSGSAAGSGTDFTIIPRHAFELAVQANDLLPEVRNALERSNWIAAEGIDYESKIYDVEYGAVHLAAALPSAIATPEELYIMPSEVASDGDIKMAISNLGNVVEHRNRKRSGLEQILSFITYADLQQIVEEIQPALWPAHLRGVRLGRELMVRLQEINNRIILDFVVLSAAKEMGNDLAARILDQMEADLSGNGMVRRPLRYLLPCNTGIIVDLAIDATFWTEHW